MSLLPNQIHPSWRDFLNPEISKILNVIEQRVGEMHNPAKECILRFLGMDLDGIKIVILGQDPYPEKGVATGRAFEVGTLKTWEIPFRQVSLKNIIRLIYKATNRIEEYNAIPRFSQIVQEMKSGRFLIPNPPAFFDDLESQGVLFLNTCFTVYPGEPLSHRDYWQPFTEALIQYISHKNPYLCWFLWGKSAQSYKPIIFQGNFYESRHPMMCSKVYSDDFLKSECIKNTMKIVNWTGN